MKTTREQRIRAIESLVRNIKTEPTSSVASNFMYGMLDDIDTLTEALKAREAALADATSRIAAQEALLERAAETIHDEFCGDGHHPQCILADLASLSEK